MSVLLKLTCYLIIVACFHPIVYLRKILNLAKLVKNGVRNFT